MESARPYTVTNWTTITHCSSGQTEEHIKFQVFRSSLLFPTLERIKINGNSSPPALILGQAESWKSLITILFPSWTCNLQFLLEYQMRLSTKKEAVGISWKINKKEKRTYEISPKAGFLIRKSVNEINIIKNSTSPLLIRKDIKLAPLLSKMKSSFWLMDTNLTSF
jgi:hypothetical protein